MAMLLAHWCWTAAVHKTAPFRELASRDGPGSFGNIRRILSGADMQPAEYPIVRDVRDS